MASTSYTLNYINTPWIGTDIENAQNASAGLTANNVFTGSNTFTQAIIAEGGITGSTASFFGLLSAEGGLTGSTAYFSSLVSVAGGITGSTAYFSELVSVAGGLTGSTASFSGLLTAAGGLEVPLGQTATFDGPVYINGPIHFSGATGPTSVVGGVINIDLHGWSLGNFNVGCTGETGVTGITIENISTNAQFNMFLTADGSTGIIVEKTLGTNIYNNLSGRTYFAQGSRWWVRGASPDGVNVYLVFANVTN